MSVLNTTVMTLADLAKVIGPSQEILDTIELLSQINDFNGDLPYREGNMPTGHMYNVRIGLPEVYWRLMNKGVPTSKSRTAQATDNCAMLEARSHVDIALAAISGNAGKLRFQEARPFLEAMSQEVVGTSFYGNAGLSPEEFTGLSPRYSVISGATNRSHILDGGGTSTDNSSIWLIGMGEDGLQGIYPQGSTAGVQHKDLGEDDVVDADGNTFRAWKDWWCWKPGLVLPDWRHVVRICNIDISNLIAKSSAADLPELMIKATHRLPRNKQVKYYWYMNRTCLEMLDIQLRDDVGGGGQLKYDVVDGLPVTTFRGIPVRICDQLLETESRVV